MSNEGPVRIFLGTCCYRTIEPATAGSRERLLWSSAQAEWDGPRMVGAADVRVEGERLESWRSADVEIVGVGMAEGYGACRNAEDLAAGAMSAGADLLVYHDADMAFSTTDVLSLCTFWDELGPKAIVGTLYPSSKWPDRYVGRLEGVGLDADRTEGTPRATVDALAPGAYAAEALGFGLVALPVALLAELRQQRGFAFAEAWRGRDGTTPDTEMCAAARLLGYSLVADLRARPRHLVRDWRSV